MSESFVNKYVVNIRSGHPGYRDFQIIATREEWKELLTELDEALANLDNATSPMSISEFEGEQLLVSKYATISRGQTSRVSISFYTANGLAVHHAHGFKHFWNEYSYLLLGAITLGVLYLAGIGASTIIGNLSHH